MEILTLREFLGQIRQTFEFAYPLQYQITAEIARLNIHPQSGHCFCDLVEKEEDIVVAKASGVVWKSNLSGILKKFREIVGEELKEGMKVLLIVEVRFHELYGLRLNIVDIDPSYTLGEFALYRKKIIERLEKEGLLTKNKQISFPLVPQRIAVISSESSAGYEDFLNTLLNNIYGYRFFVTLFPAYMQGEAAESSILNAMETCLSRMEKERYDILVIIRGGGDNVDLHCFDSYKLGKAIACFPLPVLSGIGHTRDETIVDMVSYKKLITPTATGEFIVAKMKAFEDSITEIAGWIVDITREIISQQKTYVKELEKHFTIFTDFFTHRIEQKFNNTVDSFREITMKIITNQKTHMKELEKHLSIFTDFFIHKKEQRFISTISQFINNVSKNITSREFFLKQVPSSLSSSLRMYIKNNFNLLERYEEKISLINPVNILKRGYSITFKNGRVIKDVDNINEGDIIETQLYKGKIKSKVEGKNDRE